MRRCLAERRLTPRLAARPSPTARRGCHIPAGSSPMGKVHDFPKHHVGTETVSSSALPSPLLHAVEKGPGDEAQFGQTAPHPAASLRPSPTRVAGGSRKRSPPERVSASWAGYSQGSRNTHCQSTTVARRLSAATPLRPPPSPRSRRRRAGEDEVLFAGHSEVARPARRSFRFLSGVSGGWVRPPSGSNA